MDSDTNTSPGVADTATPASLRRATWTEDENPSAVVVELVAEVTGRAPTDLEPLQQSVDTDALNALFDSAEASQLDVTFTYEGLDVHVSDTGFVEVRA